LYKWSMTCQEERNKEDLEGNFKVAEDAFVSLRQQNDMALQINNGMATNLQQVNYEFADMNNFCLRNV
jgi:hypothetical protein